MNAFKSLLNYLNAIEYLKDNTEIIEDLYNILINNDALNTANYTLGILIIICNFLKDVGAEHIVKAAEKYAKKNETKIFKELVNFINDSSIDIKINSITLIWFLLSNSNKFKQAKIILHLQEVEITKILEKNADFKSEEFQHQLTNYQKVTGEIIRGSNYEIEIYKKKNKEMEKHCRELEKKVEFVFLNQKFYEEIVDDFITFKKLADVCSDLGGYFDPCKKS